MRCRDVVLVIAILAAVGAAIAKDKIDVFGVSIKGGSPLLTKHLVQAASDAASAFGIQKRHTIEVIDGMLLEQKFDERALLPHEREVWERASLPPTQKYYVLVTGVFGGGCVAVPTWSFPSKQNAKRSPVGVTRMRCAMSEVGYARLIKVAAVAMAI